MNLKSGTAGAVIAVGLLAGCGDGVTEEDLAAEKAASKKLEAQVADLQRQLKDSVEQEQTAEERARAEAQAGLAKETAALDARKAEVDAASQKLVEREKAVGLAEAEAAANTFQGNGVYIVGDDVQPGTYKSSGGGNCYWARKDMAGDIIDNYLGSGATVLVIRGSDFQVEVSGCAPFTKS